jgi:photosystem II stability/assembly factor-like uncharacterized protein
MRQAGAAIGVWTLLSAAIFAASEPATAGKSPAPAFSSLPLCFEANRGQVDSQVRFLARGRGHNFFLAPAEAVVVLNKSLPTADVRRRQVRHAGRAAVQTKSVRFRLVGADPQAHMSGLDLLSGKVNYFLGTDPLEWRSGISTYQKVQVQQAYPGVDVVYRASGQQLEYDFYLAPGADPGSILLQIEGADRAELDATGNLIVEIGGERIHQHRPLAYQLHGDVRRAIAVAYRRTGERTFRFTLGNYDPELPLVIDPVLSYSTYLGGSQQDSGWDIALDGSGNVYVAGESLSTQLATTPGAFQTNYGGGTTVGGDIFVAKLDASGSNLVYLTYIGGKGDDAAFGIAIDGGGNAYLTGFTDSPNFPLASAIITNLSGTAEPYFELFPPDAFVTKLNATGSALVYSTYLGGNTNDQGIGIAVDASGSAYVTGFTDSTNFPIRNALQITNAGFDDVFVTKVAPDGSAFIYSTYLGGTNTDQGEGIAVDAAGRAFVTGFTQSTNFPTVNALQPWLAGGQDIFVSVLGPGGTNLVQSTYLGSGGNEIGFRIALDPAGNAYVTGSEDDFRFPVTPSDLNPGGIYRSDDGGATWNSSSAGLVHVNIKSLGIDPVAPGKIYAGTAHGVARSGNGGATWETIIGGSPTTTGLAPSIAVDGVTALAIDPVAPATVYGGTAAAGVFKSLDGGVNWSLTSTGLLNLSVNALAVDPLTPATLYAGTAGGVYRSTNGAANWSAFNSGLGSQNVGALAVNPATPATLYAATANGVYRSVNRATNWSAVNNGLTNLSTLSLVINPVTPSTVYVGTAQGLFKTVNSGTNWNGLHVAAGVSNYNALAIDPQSPSTLYAATSAGLFQSTDAGGAWTLRSLIFPNVLAVHPQTGAVFAGMFGSASFGLKDAYAIKLGSKVEYSVVFGGTSDDEGWDVALDSTGNAYVVGVTASTNFPVALPLPSQSANRGRSDAFVTAIDASGSAWRYSTYLGGQADDLAFGIEVDLAGAAYVVGQTLSTNFPTTGGLQPLAGGMGDAFVAKLIVIPPPELNVASTNGHVILSWPAVAFGYVLQTRTNLVATNAWANVTNAPVRSGGAYLLTLGATNQSRFFRLISP